MVEETLAARAARLARFGEFCQTVIADKSLSLALAIEKHKVQAPSTIYRAVKGNHGMTTKTLKALAKVLDVPEDMLISVYKGGDIPPEYIRPPMHHPVLEPLPEPEPAGIVEPELTYELTNGPIKVQIIAVGMFARVTTRIDHRFPFATAMELVKLLAEGEEI